MWLHRPVLIVCLILAFQLKAAASEQAGKADKKQQNVKKQATIEKQIRENQAQIDKLTPFLNDPDFSQPDVKSVVADKLFRLRCTNKVLKLESALGAAAVSKDERKGVFNACMEAAQHRLKESEGEKSSQQVSGALPADCGLPPAVPVNGIPMLRTLTEGGDTIKPTKYDRWRVSTTKDTGTQVVREHTVQVQYFNILRYRGALGAAVNFTDGPTLPSPLVPGVAVFPSLSPPATAAESTIQAEKPGSRKFAAVFGEPVNPEQFQKIWITYSACFELAQKRVLAIDHSINNAVQATQTTVSNINAVLNSHPAKIVSDYKPLRKSAEDALTFGQFYDFEWPTQKIAELQDSITKFRDLYNKLSNDPNYSAWAKLGGNKDAFDFIKAQTDKMIEHLNSLAPTSDAAGKLQAAQDSVRQWRNHFNDVFQTDVNGFLPSYDAGCGAWFGKGKTTAVKLFIRDLTNPATEETADLITVVCNPPLTVTTGLGFSFIPNRIPAFVPGIEKDANGNDVKDASGNPVIVDTLGFSSESNVTPIYALQINGAIKEWRRPGLGLHATLGAAVGGANDATNLQFLAGISFSFFRRAFFVTPAYQLAERTGFLSGFNPGNVKGNLTSLPTEQHPNSGFALTITFPILK
jgi:hypothetical protein